jgi:choline monooxygenase
VRLRLLVRRRCGGGGAKRRDAAIAWSDEIQREDIALCESVQRNLASRSYVSGRYSVRRENGLYHFHERLRRDLGGALKPPRRSSK